MKNNLLSGEFANQNAINELIRQIDDLQARRIQVRGLYGSSKSLVFSSTVIVINNLEILVFLPQIIPWKGILLVPIPVNSSLNTVKLFAIKK